MAMESMIVGSQKTMKPILYSPVRCFKSVSITYSLSLKISGSLPEFCCYPIRRSSRDSIITITAAIAKKKKLPYEGVITITRA